MLPFRYGRTSLAIISAALLLVGFVTISASAQEKIKIGVLTDLSGAGSYYGHQTRVGVLLTEQDLRAKGKEVQFIFEDSALNTRQGLSAAQKLLLIDRVEALYVDFTVISVAVSSLVETNKRLMLYSAAAESVALKNPLAFKTYSNYRQGCEALARQFKLKGVERIGVLKAEAEYGELCLEGVKNVYDMFSEQSYKQGENVSSQILSFKSKDVQAIINGALEGDVVNMLQASRNLGYNVMVGAAEDTFTAGLREKFRASLQGSMSFGLQRLPEDIIERARKIDGGDKLTAFEGVGLSYVHTGQLFAALEGCRGKAIECAAEKLASSPPDNRVGFEGWKQRMAQLRTTVKEFRSGEFQKVATYLTGEGD